MTPNELRKRIQSIQNTLDQIKTQLEAIAEQSKPANRNSTPDRPQSVPIFDSEVKLPPSISSYYDAENNERKTKTIFKYIEIGIGLGGLIAITAYVIVTACTLSQIKKQADSGQSQIGIMQNQLEATDRAWVKVRPVVSSPVTFNNDGAMQMSFQFDLVNVGHSVATNATIYAGLLAQSFSNDRTRRVDPFKEPTQRQKALCEKPSLYNFTVTLYPGDPVRTWNVGVGLTQKEMEDRLIPRPIPGPGVVFPPIPPDTEKRIAPMLFGCVDYQLSTLPKHHQTGFIYSISRIEPNNSNVPFSVIVRQVLPINRIGLERWLFGGDYAN